MAKRTVFTIVAKNYVGLANVLGDSIKSYSENTDFFVFIADELEQSFIKPNTAFTYLIAKDVLGIDDKAWYNMAFKYGVTEFCTSIKPFCFLYLFNALGFEDIIYFDPDILLFSPLQPIWQTLEKKEVVLTPHILTQEIEYSGTFPETNILCTGIYNLGFLAVRKTTTTINFIEWWRNRLVNYCFVDKIEGLYTDQKWIDFLPGFLNQDSLEISRDAGMNVAPWNFYARKVIREGNEWFVVNRVTNGDRHKLLFVHFSGFNYKQLEEDPAQNRNMPFLKLQEDILPVFKYYADLLKKSDIFKYFAYQYSYSNFDNGKPIMHFHRRLFRRLLIDDKITGNPFHSYGKDTFYSLLNRKHLIPKNGTQNADKLNERNFDGFESKLYKVNIYHTFLQKVLGAKFYFLLTKFMLRYYRPENQVFLLYKEYMNSSFKNEIY